MSQTFIPQMSPDPYPMCAQKECGYPVSGCRYLGCINQQCRNNHLHQGVELNHKPASEFEFFEKFETQEVPWRSSRTVLPVAHGYEIPYKPSKHYIPADEMKETSLKCNAIPTKKEAWRAQRRCFPESTGSMCEDTTYRRRFLVPPPVEHPDPWRPCTRACEYASPKNSEKGWKPARHQSGKIGRETTQQDFHPQRRHIPKGGSTATMRFPKKGPGIFNKNDGEWQPPFRDPNPELELQQALECASRPVRKTGKKSAPPLCHQGEWQPNFRSSISQSVPSIPHRVPSQQRLRHIDRQPDEWCPPWKDSSEDAAAEFENDPCPERETVMSSNAKQWQSAATAKTDEGEQNTADEPYGTMMCNPEDEVQDEDGDDLGPSGKDEGRRGLEAEDGDEVAQ
ncbi:uncharacterized protein [Physcomitrium patens]|uniref:uncharacterized protein isoform X2 n=1 Tax=Physcomitrium patens TaxID=3218 RepID=UPI003CCD6C02